MRDSRYPGKGQLSEIEKSLLVSGVRYLAGVDEVGRGCLAGPVVAASIIFPPEKDFPFVTDSKLLKAQDRERIYDLLCDQAYSLAIASVDPGEIDRMNIHQASLQAMRCAVSKLSKTPDYLLVDGRYPLDVSIPQKAIVHGDRQCLVIGAASIIAKVWRDRLMTRLQETYPSFQFAKHKGYSTRLHREELKRYGPTRIHRKSFRGVGQLVLL